MIGCDVLSRFIDAHGIQEISGYTDVLYAMPERKVYKIANRTNKTDNSDGADRTNNADRSVSAFPALAAPSTGTDLELAVHDEQK